MLNENQLQETQETQEIRVQSVYIPENWLKNQERKSIAYLEWMANHIESVHYFNDNDMSKAMCSL